MTGLPMRYCCAGAQIRDHSVKPGGKRVKTSAFTRDSPNRFPIGNAVLDAQLIWHRL